MDDTRIIELIRANEDQQAFTALYAHFPKVERLVRANGGSRADAKDIFQDALIIFHRKARAADFMLTASISTFLFAVCRNLWRDELRRRNKALTGWKTEGDADEPADFGSLLARESDFNLAEKALRSLGGKCLDVLTRFYLKSEPLQMIAQALGLAGEGAAKTRKYKCLEEARRRYRELIAKETVVMNLQHP